MHLPTPTSTLLSALTLAHLLTPCTASLLSLLPRAFDFFANLQNAICTTKKQSAVPGYDTSCKVCNCFCIAEAEVGCYFGCSDAAVSMLRDLRTRHNCGPYGDGNTFKPDYKNDWTYEWELGLK
ncbi:hypothetical protein MMC26_004865 [Xylographa opegraphella]|nr:hypothetical protein [Xylographa opegraphella]